MEITKDHPNESKQRLAIQRSQPPSFEFGKDRKAGKALQWKEEKASVMP